MKLRFYHKLEYLVFFRLHRKMGMLPEPDLEKITDAFWKLYK